MGFDDLYPEQAARNEQREEAQQRADLHHGEAVRLLMDSKSGRVFVREFLDLCGVFKAYGPRQSDMLQYQEGLRMAGLWLFTALVRDNSEHIQKILREEE